MQWASGALAGLLGEGGKDVEAEREQLEADEDDEQILGRGYEQAAGRGHEDDSHELAGIAGEGGVDKQQKLRAVRARIAHLRYGGGAACGEQDDRCPHRDWPQPAA